MSLEKTKLLEKEKLSDVIKGWVEKNKKVFWKYEVSCYFETYRITVNNLPDPAEKDISVSPNKKLLNSQQKLQLCTTITKACAKIVPCSNSSIDMKLDYDDGAVIAVLL